MRYKIVLPIFLLIISMFCLAFAAVPLYRIFCKVTGYGGTVKISLPTEIKQGSKFITVRFNADVDNMLPWSFKPEINSVNVRTGQQQLVFYWAENLTNSEIDGMAVYNVTPFKVGKYFNKIACFCFTKQTLLPNQKVVMPVSFFIDSAIENDPDTLDVDTITLSYTFFKYKDEN